MRGATTRAAAVLATTAVAVSAAPADARTAHRPSCQRPDTVTVARNHLARVFRDRHRGLDDRVRLFGCLGSVGRRVRLATAFDDGYVTAAGYRRVRLAGRFVAWSSWYSDMSCKADCPPGYEPVEYAVNVRDLRAKRSRSLVTGSSATALVLARFGAIAWAEGGGDNVTLSAFDAQGRRELATGRIEARSLAVDGATLSWRQDGQQRSTELAR